MSQPPRPVSLTHRTGWGALWFLGQTLTSKVFTTAAQLLLFGVLAQADFGLIAIVTTVVSFAGLAQQLGVRDVLIQRQAEFDTLRDAAFWLQVVAGVVAALAIVVSAPITAALYSNAQLMALILACAVMPPLDALGTLPSARLQIDFRFRELAAFLFLSTLLGAAVSVVLAFSGFGAMSVIVGRIASSSVNTVLLWWASPVRIPKHLDLAHWHRLLGASSIILATTFFATLVQNGDYLLLGLFASPATLGGYYFAFGLSTQALSTITANLNSVLFPVFAKLQENPARQLEGYATSTLIAGIVGTPLPLLQAIFAAPLLHLLYRDKADEVIRALEVLSISMSLAVSSGLATAMIRGQGKFLLYFQWTVFVAVSFVLCAGVGASFGSATSTAWGVLVFNVTTNPLVVYLAVHRARGYRVRTMKAYGLPLVLAGVCFVGPWLIMRVAGLATETFQIACMVAALGSLLYVGAVRVCAPAVWSQMGAIRARLALRENVVSGTVQT